MSTDMRTPASTSGPTTGLDRFFRITERGSNVSRELRGGLVTFFTMAYIVVLNPIILSGVVDGSGQMIGGTTDLTQSKLLVAVGTAVVAGVMSILMGLVANFPIALAAGLGINGLITGMVITHASDKVTYADLMGLVVIEGVIILVLVLTGFRKAVFRAIPAPLKVAISVGIGLFIAYIGVIDAGFARRPSIPGSTPSELGIAGSLTGWPTLVFVVGRLPHRRAAHPQGQGRDPHRHRGRDRARDGARGDLPARARASTTRRARSPTPTRGS